MSSKREGSIVVLCGLPGSGKSSLSLKIKKWLLEFDEIIPLVISYDELMPPSVESELINQQCEDKSKWKIYREAIVELVQNFITDIINSESNLGSAQSIKKWVSKNVSKDSNEVDNHSDLNSDFHRILKKRFSKLINEQMSGVIEKKDELKEDKKNGMKEERDELKKEKMDELKEEKDELKQDSKKIVIIIDDNMYFRSMRYDYYQLARNSSIGFCQVYVACSVDLALESNSQRTCGIVEPEVINNMANKFQIPDKYHHSWEKYSLECSTDNLQIYRKEILDLIQTALDNPVKPTEEIDPEIIAESQRICCANVVHQADLILRQLISEIMIKRKDCNDSKADLKKLGKQLANGKSKILHDLREGKITITMTQDEVNNSSKDKNNPFFLLLKHQFDELFS